MKLLRVGLWVLVGIAAIAASALYLAAPGERSQQSRTLPGALKVGGPFQLTSHTGERFDSASLNGEPFLIFFGFTHCPDICPTTLLEITNQLNSLGDESKDLKALFVTVDPERDTAPHLAKYLESFDKRIVGLTGSAAEIQNVANQYFVKYQRVEAEEGSDPSDYTMNHTATVFLIDRKGNFAGTLSFAEKPDVRLRKLRRLLKS